MIFDEAPLWTSQRGREIPATQRDLAISWGLAQTLIPGVKLTNERQALL